MRRAAPLALLFILLACERASGPDDVPLAGPPDAVVATVSTGSLAQAMTGLRAYLDAIRPGASLMMTDGLVAGGLARAAGASSLDGIDLAAPLHVIFLDGPERLVVAGKAADRAALDKAHGAAHLLVRDGWALLGPRDAVELIAPWVVPTLVASRPTAAVQATVHVDRLMTRHAAAITELRETAAARLAASDPNAGRMITEYLNGLFALAGDSARLTASLAIDAARAELDLALVPRPASALAGFVAAQKPSDFALLAALPADAPTGIVMAGHVELGPYRSGALAMFGRMMNFGDGAATFLDAFTTLADLATGDFAAAFTMSPAGTQMVEIVPVSDAAAAARAIGAVAAATAGGAQVEAMGMRMTHAGHPNQAQHAGAVIHGLTTTVDRDSVPPLQREMFDRMYGGGGQELHIAFPDGALVATTGALERCKHAVDARAGRAERLRPPAATAAVFDAARARRDSLALVIDLVGLLGGLRAALVPGAPPPPASSAPGLALAVGFADRAAHLRLALRAETVRALAAAATPAQ
jgi:hypothetical protein